MRHVPAMRISCGDIRGVAWCFWNWVWAPIHQASSSTRSGKWPHGIPMQPISASICLKHTLQRRLCASLFAWMVILEISCASLTKARLRCPKRIVQWFLPCLSERKSVHITFCSCSYSLAHFSSASRTGMNLRPISVREYSTRGGTSRYTSRCIKPYCSSIRSSFVKFASVTCGI